MAILASHFELLSISNGIATIRQMCWGCGNECEIEIPLDDVGTEECTSKMCVDCVIRFCSVEKI